MTEAASSLYFGRVMHHRLRPFPHRFTYRVFSIWLDIDQYWSLSDSGQLDHSG